jgi:hypothetical protein
MYWLSLKGGMANGGSGNIGEYLGTQGISYTRVLPLLKIFNNSYNRKSGPTFDTVWIKPPKDLQKGEYDIPRSSILRSPLLKIAIMHSFDKATDNLIILTSETWHTMTTISYLNMQCALNKSLIKYKRIINLCNLSQSNLPNHFMLKYTS